MYVQNCNGVFIAVICFWMVVEVEVEGAGGICFGSGCSGTTALQGHVRFSLHHLSLLTLLYYIYNTHLEKTSSVF